MAPAACEYVIEILLTWMSFLSEMIHFECLKKRFFNNILMFPLGTKYGTSGMQVCNLSTLNIDELLERNDSL